MMKYRVEFRLAMIYGYAYYKETSSTNTVNVPVERVSKDPDKDSDNHVLNLKPVVIISANSFAEAYHTAKAISDSYVTLRCFYSAIIESIERIDEP